MPPTPFGFNHPDSNGRYIISSSIEKMAGAQSAREVASYDPGRPASTNYKEKMVSEEGMPLSESNLEDTGMMTLGEEKFDEFDFDIDNDNFLDDEDQECFDTLDDIKLELDGAFSCIETNEEMMGSKQPHDVYKNNPYSLLSYNLNMGAGKGGYDDARMFAMHPHSHNHNHNSVPNQNVMPEIVRGPRIKKPLNAFMLYMKEVRPALLKETNTKDSIEINKMIGKMWQELGKEEQARFFEKAKMERELHRQMYPNYSKCDSYVLHRKKKRRRDKNSIGEPLMKKCRARYGLDQQDKWCKPCRRKKRCIKYMYTDDELLEEMDEDSCPATPTMNIPEKLVEKPPLFPPLNSHSIIKPNLNVNNNINNENLNMACQQGGEANKPKLTDLSGINFNPNLNDDDFYKLPDFLTKHTDKPS